MTTFMEMEQIVRDYHWMINSVKVIREGMGDMGGLTAQYGVEAAMPKRKGGHSDPIYREATRRERRMKKVYEYEKKIQLVQERMTLIEDDREFEVLHWMLEGKSLRWIGRHMQLSDRHIGRIKDSVIQRLVSESPVVVN
ncbi:DNA-binding response regulator [Sporosarcina sp. Te-1]|uniref:DNA-binding response regulator n=1 Tax=Sporosarcina sp. Te-1 TaxID=2818390 RepID=UPI001A9CEB65|nr:DNA-binding response regulator [Sporosarcina sp. Te-1]QTD39927.1 DNA-binding response regulator [Sporosarcina sp. Te-1]